MGSEMCIRDRVDGAPPYKLPSVHADRFGDDMTTEQAIESIRSVYRRGYRLPEVIQ